jgi:tRNA (cytidine/uridine-2'-O-)-methyltransferase
MGQNNGDRLSFRIVLYQPEIPANTGNIGRLCVGANAELHIIKPMKFFLNDKYLKRAGLDYWDKVKLFVHDGWNSFVEQYTDNNVYLVETCGESFYYEEHFKQGDIFVFGSETKGLPESILKTHKTIKIPMSEEIRSINMCNSVAIVLYEGLRQVLVSV